MMLLLLLLLLMLLLMLMLLCRHPSRLYAMRGVHLFFSSCAFFSSDGAVYCRPPNAWKGVIPPPPPPPSFFLVG